MQASPPSPVMSLREWGMLLLLSLLWGGTFLFARIAVLEIPPLTVVLARVAIAALVLNIVLLFLTTRFQHSWSVWAKFGIMGLINNIIPFALIFYGQLEIGAGLAAIVNAMTPIWTVLIAHAGTNDERLSSNKIAGVIFGFSGVAVLIGAAALSGFAASAWAQIAVLGATLSYGFASVFGRQFANVPPIQTARGQLTASTLLMLPIALWFDQPWTMSFPSFAAAGSVVLMAVACTAFAYILYFEILAKAGAVNVALVTFLIPPSAIILGIIFLGEVLATRHIVGMALIFLGLIVIDGRLHKKLSNQT